MMPDLGKYALYVFGAYGSAILLIGGLVFATWRQSVGARAKLAASEARNNG